MYLTLNCHHQNDFCITMSSDDSRFNESLIVSGKVMRQRPQTTASEEKGELGLGFEPSRPLTARPNQLKNSK